MSFESELARGRFRVPECARCRAATWPHTAACPSCLGPVTLRAGEPEGEVVECSGEGGAYFCLVDFGGARLVASSGRARGPGERVRMARCGMRGSRCFFEI